MLKFLYYSTRIRLYYYSVDFINNSFGRHYDIMFKRYQSTNHYQSMYQLIFYQGGKNILNSRIIRKSK